MTLMDAVARVLWADATFKAASPGGIAAVLAPETASAYPVTTYLVVGGAQESTLQTSGFQRLRVEFNCRADEASGGYAAAGSARAALTAVLNGFFGLVADGTYLQNCEPLGNMDDFDSGVRQWRCMAEFYLFFTLS